jgi:hypothetical protein
MEANKNSTQVTAAFLDKFLHTQLHTRHVIFNINEWFEAGSVAHSRRNGKPKSVLTEEICHLLYNLQFRALYNQKEKLPINL